jgi:cell division protein FtsQ
MGRKQSAQLSLVIPEEEPVAQELPPQPEPPAPRRVRAKPAEKGSGWGRKARNGLLLAAIMLVIVAAIAGAYQVDEFLASDSHFILAGSADARENPNLTVEGIAYVSRTEVMQVFARDFGRSIYLMPLAERRRSLLGIDWVRDATVSRRWPNRIGVRIFERKPFAFALLPGVTSKGWTFSETALIDADGVILRPARGRFSLPVLFGLSRQEAPEARRDSVRRAAEMLREVQANAGQISEIDVSDPEDLTITEVVEGRPLRLRLGSRNYLSRLSNFLNHYPDIGRRLPNTRTFDLRLDDHITAEGGTQ